MLYTVSTHDKLDSQWLKLSYSNTLPSPSDVPFIFQVFQSCKLISDFNLILFFDCYIIHLHEIKSLHNKLLRCSFTYGQSLSNFRKCQITVSTVSSSKRYRTSTICLNTVFYLSICELFGYAFSHPEKSKCIYECCNVRTFYS